ncbi:hypothetical protein [Maribacter luteus]|uniref:Uncharacterized protein n=1 Tax=Maribacter luteus TaxID=2594478 RepID=A0A6I2MNN7_9FLAO|nr:hypothetical protein [Maribacter luteus]MRX63874.1 hypothetical protein [Maribacter luteus]
MYSKNWGYQELRNDVENIFSNIFATHKFAITGSTDEVSYVNFKNPFVTLYIGYDDSKMVEFIFKTPTGEEYNIETCCLIKNVPYKTPICEFRDRECILKGLTYIERIISKYSQQELQGIFNYKEEYQLLEDERYYINKEIAFLPIEDPFYQKIKNNYTPGARVELMREKLIQENKYPEKFKTIFYKYLNTKQS